MTTAELLEAWEGCVGRPPAQRAVSLLCLACPDQPRDVLERLSIGRRDAHLLALRERVFGPRLACVASCPDCGADQELGFDVEDVLLPLADHPGEELVARVGDHEVRYRLPDSRDVVAAAGDAAWRVLLVRCVLSATRGTESVGLEDVPDAVIGAVVDGMARADPQADMEVALDCPACGHRWVALFDIALVLWGELQLAAERALRDVHALASAYGWDEPTVLALSPLRRQAYLDLVGT